MKESIIKKIIGSLILVLLIPLISGIMAYFDYNQYSHTFLDGFKFVFIFELGITGIIALFIIVMKLLIYLFDIE